MEQIRRVSQNNDYLYGKVLSVTEMSVLEIKVCLESFHFQLECKNLHKKLVLKNVCIGLFLANYVLFF